MALRAPERKGMVLQADRQLIFLYKIKSSSILFFLKKCIYLFASGLRCGMQAVCGCAWASL